MADKKDRARFTIQFSETDPSHLQVIDILNRQGRRSKAPYIVNAVLHYENRDEASARQPHSPAIDIEMIEAVVIRLLKDRNREKAVAGKKEPPQQKRTSKKPTLAPDNLLYDDALDALGQDGLDVIAGALDAFRQK